MDFKELPVYKNKEEILKGLRENQAIVVESPTGSGKTTQLPLILLEAGYANSGIIGITQPRRIATLSVTDFIKKQINCENNFVAYKMRFYDTTDLNTRIKIMTDGILLQELKLDPILSKYSVIMVDEAHERSLNIDFILGLLKNILEKRPDLKVIISSATINTKTFSKFFNNCKIVSIKSRTYPVQVKYLPITTNNNIDEIVDTIVSIVNFKIKNFVKHDCQINDDILIFLPGEFDIKLCLKEIAYRCDHTKLQLYPLYGRLNKEDQELVFTPTAEGKIKIVIATNIAETSVTIDGIKNVIDCGYAKVNFYNQRDYSNSLVTTKISKSSCEQRKGRAGRTAPGFCYRLYSEDDYNSRPMFSTEEILRTDLSEVGLRMSDLGIYDYEHFAFITRPNRGAILSAEETLRQIGAIDKERHLTNIGQIMVQFPLAPRHSRVIVESLLNYPDVIEEILVAVSFLSVRTPFVLPVDQEDVARNAHRRFANKSGDFASFLEIFAAYTNLVTPKQKQDFCNTNFMDMQTLNEIVHVNEQLGEIVGSLGFPLLKGGDQNKYLTCLAVGLKQYVCIKTSSILYRSLFIDKIYIHPGSAWFRENPQFILAGEVVNTSRMYARTVSPLTKDLVNNVVPQLLNFAPSEKKLARLEKGQRQEQMPAKTVTLYGKTYLATTTKTKRGKKEIIVQIPIEELRYLSKMQAKSRRHPQNFKAALMIKNKFIHKGDTLFNIIDLYSKLPENLVPIDLRKERNFKSDDIELLESKLNDLGRLAILPYSKDELGFVELCSAGKDTYYLGANDDYFDCLTNTSYTLMSLKDKIKGNAILNKTYSRIMNLLNQY